jgi:hypothetical protein
MSRGLSCQRRQILGLGRAVNRAVNGELRLIEGVIDASKEHWRVPVLFGYGFPEIVSVRRRAPVRGEALPVGDRVLA